MSPNDRPSDSHAGDRPDRDGAAAHARDRPWPGDWPDAAGDNILDRRADQPDAPPFDTARRSAPFDGFPELSAFGAVRLQWEDVVDKARRVLEQSWQLARMQILNAGVVNADDEMWMLSDPEHMGDPMNRIDRWLHQMIARLIAMEFPSACIYGEEDKPLSLLLDRRTFNIMAYLDALDGSRQAFSLPGAWSINLVLQQYVGIGIDGLPRCRRLLLAVIDAEGVSGIWTPGTQSVELRLAGRVDAATAHGDQLLVNDGDDFGITGELTVLAGGYKPAGWGQYKKLRELLSDVPSFNTAGGPVARKAIQNNDVVVVQLTASTLWNGVAAGLVAAAGGYVVPVGATEPLPNETVLDWFDTFGYERRDDDPSRLTERLCIPPFIAGMSANHVDRVVAAARDAFKRDH